MAWWELNSALFTQLKVDDLDHDDLEAIKPTPSPVIVLNSIAKTRQESRQRSDPIQPTPFFPFFLFLPHNFRFSPPFCAHTFQPFLILDWYWDCKTQHLKFFQRFKLWLLCFGQFLHSLLEATWGDMAVRDASSWKASFATLTAPILWIKIEQDKT